MHCHLDPRLAWLAGADAKDILFNGDDCPTLIVLDPATLLISAKIILEQNALSIAGIGTGIDQGTGRRERGDQRNE
jgi:hypothetical protein